MTNKFPTPPWLTIVTNFTSISTDIKLPLSEMICRILQYCNNQNQTENSTYLYLWNSSFIILQCKCWNQQ